MGSPTFYSDRLRGPREPVNSALPAATALGLLSLVQTRLDQNWFAESFPDPCGDGNGVAGTDVGGLRLNLQALVPGTPWPLTDVDSSTSDEVVFDVIEYAAARVARPENGPWHSYYRHYELNFDRQAGATAFRSDVNQMLQRGRAMYELTTAGEVHRTGSPQVQEVQRTLVPATGDALLDGLINEARTRYASHRPDERRIGLEKLWDAFERLKSLEVPGRDKKKESVARLLSRLPGGWRQTVEEEMVALTGLGNTYAIRHFETQTASLPDDAAVDYVYGRMGALLTLLLVSSGRLGSAVVPDSVADDDPFESF